MFQRKQYDAIAGAISYPKTKKEIVDSLCNLFAWDNENFSEKKFRDACGKIP